MIATSGPSFYPPWREEFNSLASWGKHPTAWHQNSPEREWRIEDKGPSPKPGIESERPES